MLLDIRTVMLSHVLTDVLCALVLMTLWRQNRARFSGTGFWTLDFAFQAIGALLVISRSIVPEWVSTVLGNALVIAGALLGYIGLEHFVAKVGSQRHNYVVLFAFVLVQVYFSVVRPSLEVRTLNISAALFILCAQCSWLMLRRVDATLRPVTRNTGIVFSAFALVSLLRIIVMLVSKYATQDLFQSAPSDTLSLLTYQMLLILLAYSLALMVNRRLLAEMQMQHEQLRQASLHDALTGVYNRGFFEAEIARLQSGRRVPVSMVVADLNGLKETNDRLGHAAGDELLVRAARILQSAFRTEDIVARLGGDEFAVLLPDTDNDAACRSLERIRLSVAADNAAHAGAALSVAIGLATAAQGESLAATLERADASMYADKQTA